MNQDQIDYWNGETGEKWTRNADRLDALLAPFNDVVLQAANFAGGADVLDIGCGAGALSVAALARGARAVTGVDVSQPLLALARSRAATFPERVRFIEGDAAALVLDAAVDAAISRYGVMFFNNPQAAFAQLRRNVRPDGGLAFVCWRALDENDWARAPLAAAMPHFRTPPARPDPHAPGPFAFADRDRVAQILADAGWRDIAIDPWTDTLTPPGADVREQAAFLYELGPVARIVREQDIDGAAVIDGLTRLLRDTAGAAPTARLAAGAWVVTARA